MPYEGDEEGKSEGRILRALKAIFSDKQVFTLSIICTAGLFACAIGLYTRSIIATFASAVFLSALSGLLIFIFQKQETAEHAEEIFQEMVSYVSRRNLTQIGWEGLRLTFSLLGVLITMRLLLHSFQNSVTILERAKYIASSGGGDRILSQCVSGMLALSFWLPLSAYLASKAQNRLEERLTFRFFFFASLISSCSMALINYGSHWFSKEPMLNTLGSDALPGIPDYFLIPLVVFVSIVLMMFLCAVQASVMWIAARQSKPGSPRPPKRGGLRPPKAGGFYVSTAH